MNTLKIVCVGVLLAGLAAFLLSLRPNTLASSYPSGSVKAISKPSRDSTTSGLPEDWRISSPVSHENLTVFPVVSQEAATTDEYITLDEGLRSGTVKVSELGSDGQPNRTTPNSAQRNVQQHRGDGAQVNTLVINNRSGKVLVLIAGEIVIGGKQDRIVANDCIVEPSDKPVPIKVFCVEHGRWQPRSSSASTSFGSAGGVMAAPKVREKAQAKKDQSAVWSEVSEKVAQNGVSTSTGTLNSVFEDKQVKAKLDAYEAAMKGKLASKQVVGAVVAVNGVILAADVFANNGLFQAYWPKLLKSYALEAISTASGKKADLTLADAEAFLSRVGGTAAASGKDGLYRLNENQSDADASFELEHTTGKRKLIHFNRVNKK